jgi:uncharacterized protein (UPF0248 family)
MQPLQDLMHRMQWDADFGRGVFSLGYYDRVARQERIVPYASVRLDPERPDTLSVGDEEGMVRHIPLHRVRTVYKDGVVIWQRPRR